MNKKTKLFIFVIIILTIAICLVSCSKKDNQEENTTTINVSFYIGDKLYQEGQYKTGDLIYAPDIKEYNGYQIHYWTLGNDWVKMPYKAENEDLVFNAYMTKDLVVKYYVGSELFYECVINPGDKIIAPYENPTKDGYTFQYWTLNNERVSFPYKTSSNDTILNFDANFKAHSIVNFYVEGEIKYSQHVPSNSTLEYVPNPSMDGKKFICWQDENKTVLNPNSIINENKEYFAVFEQNMFEINYYVNGSLYKKLNVEKYAPNIKYPNADYFYGWYTNSSFTTLFDFSKPLTANINVYGKVVENNFGVLNTIYGSSSYIYLPQELLNSFAVKYNFDNYKNVVLLSINKNTQTASVSYKFQRSNKKNVIISYDITMGKITGAYSSSVDEGVYSTVDVAVSPFSFDHKIDASVALSYTSNGGSFDNDLKNLSLDIANYVSTELYAKYSDYIKDYDSSKVYDDVPESSFNATLNKSERTFTITSNLKATSIAIYVNNTVLYYANNIDELTYNYSDNYSYTIVVRYEYIVDGCKYLKTQNFVF